MLSDLIDNAPAGHGLARRTDARERLEEVIDRVPDLRVGIMRHVAGLVVTRAGEVVGRGVDCWHRRRAAPDAEHPQQLPDVAPDGLSRSAAQTTPGVFPLVRSSFLAIASVGFGTPCDENDRRF